MRENPHLFLDIEETREFGTFPDTVADKCSLVHRSFHDGAFLYIVHCHCNYDHYNGYVRFRRPFLQQEGTEGLMAFLPVHGGITYAQEQRDGSMVYGFDTLHDADMLSDDHKISQKRGFDWIITECQKMAAALLCMKTYDEAYNDADAIERVAVVRNFTHRLEKEMDMHCDFMSPDVFVELAVLMNEAQEERTRREKYCQCKHEPVYVEQCLAELGGICEACDKPIQGEDE